MRKVFRIIIVPLAIFCVSVGFVSANFTPNISISYMTENSNTNGTNIIAPSSVTVDAVEIVREIIERKIASGQLQNYLPSYTEGEQIDLELNALIPLKTLYNKGLGESDLITPSDLSITNPIKEWCAFIFIKDTTQPALFVTISYNTSEDQWKFHSFRSLGPRSVGDCIEYYAYLSTRHVCSQPIMYRLYSEYALSFEMDGESMVIPSSLLQWALGIRKNTDEDHFSVAVIAATDFVSIVNKAIEDQ